jgi:hypothetical protein
MDEFKDIVYCTNKNKEICSMGIQINSELGKNPVFILNSKNKKPFRDNLGVPLPLYLLKQQYQDILNIIDVNGENSLNMNSKILEEDEPQCIDKNLFDTLINLASKKKKKKNSTRNNKKKKKKKKGTIKKKN